jgi:hypothetical protein
VAQARARGLPAPAPLAEEPLRRGPRCSRHTPAGAGRGSSSSKACPSSASAPLAPGRPLPLKFKASCQQSAERFLWV